MIYQNEHRCTKSIHCIRGFDLGSAEWGDIYLIVWSSRQDLMEAPPCPVYYGHRLIVRDRTIRPLWRCSWTVIRSQIICVTVMSTRNEGVSIVKSIQWTRSKVKSVNKKLFLSRSNNNSKCQGVGSDVVFTFKDTRTREKVMSWIRRNRYRVFLRTYWGS